MLAEEFSDACFIKEEWRKSNLSSLLSLYYVELLYDGKSKDTKR